MVDENAAPRVAIVTGAGGGIGLATSSLLAEAGMTLIGYDRDETLRAAFEREVAGAGRTFVGVDVADPAAVAAATEDVAHNHGRVDVLVNAAGIRDIGDALTVRPEDWQRVLDVDLSGTFFCCQAAGRVMVAQGGGSIVNVASIAGFVGFARRPAYTVAKHGVIGLTRVLAAELGPAGVRVNAVCPGLTATPLTEAYVTEQHVVDSLRVVVPQQRAATSDEIAQAVLYLAGDGAAFVNGVALPVDGGCTAMQTFDVTGQSPTFSAQDFSVSASGL